MLIKGEASRKLYERAQKVMPNGVSSNYRNMGDEDTLMVSRGEGAYLYDADGNAYLDYRLGWGPVILGHADPFVREQVRAGLERGQVFAATHEYEVRVAERIVDLCPGVEMVRLTNTGSEATMHALRLARGYTGKDKVLKFEGCYHGAHDYLLWNTANAKLNEIGQRYHPRFFKNSKGIPDIMRELLVISPWNDIEILDTILKKEGPSLAAIILEPMLGNGNAIPPSPEFLPFLRKKCDEYGIILIFDEVKVGFRIAPGGAREYFGVIPDISTYAKAIANGYPIAAIAGKRELMMQFSPGNVFQGGTYSGNMLSAVAADATLAQIQEGTVHRKLTETGTMLMNGLGDILSLHSVPHVIHGAPALFGITFAEEQPRDWRELLLKSEFKLYESIITYMASKDILREPYALEPFYLCAALSREDVAKTLQVFEDGLKKVLAGSYKAQGILTVDSDF